MISMGDVPGWVGAATGIVALVVALRTDRKVARTAPLDRVERAFFAMLRRHAKFKILKLYLQGASEVTREERFRAVNKSLEDLEFVVAPILSEKNPLRLPVDTLESLVREHEQAILKLVEDVEPLIDGDSGVAAALEALEEKAIDAARSVWASIVKQRASVGH